jgi:hypothetical protein
VHRNRRDLFWLRLLDARLNRFRHDGGMPPPTHFRPPRDWATLFASRDLRPAAIRWLGSPLERLVHHPVLWALTVPPAAERPRADGARGGRPG